MDLNLKGKKALVTGASLGLGKAVAIALAEEGVQLYLNSRSLENLQNAAEQIKQQTGIEPVLIDADLVAQEGLDKIATSISDIDILISNAGGPPPGKFVDHDDKTWHNANQLVLESARKLTSIVISGMIKRKFGRLIYITSIGVLQPIDDLILSNTYRAAVTGMCKTISNTYAQYGITANCVCPGYTATDRLKSLAKKRSEETGITPEEVLKGFASQVPVGRIGEPKELAALITFLASEKASYITGTSIPVDGGFIKSLI